MRYPATLRLDGILQDAYAICHPELAVSIEESGSGYIYRRLTLTNPGSTNSPQITEPYTLDVSIPASTVLYHSLHGDDCSENSYLPIDRDLKPGDVMTLTPTGGRSSNTSAFPFMDLTIDGTPLLLAIGWSGQWKCTLTRSEDTLRIQVGLAHADFYVQPGETLLLPSVLIMPALEGEDAAALRRRFRRTLLTDMNPLPEGMKHLPLSLQPFDRYFWNNREEWATEAGQIRTLRGAQKCRYLDTLWIDAAWFREGFPNGVGNYSFESGFPNGLGPVADAVHEAGMRFMVWFEPERVHLKSELAANHPEYLLASPEHADNFLYNLSDDTAYDWLYNTLLNFVRDNRIDNYRQDFNIDPLPFWLAHDEADRVGITEIKYIYNFYRLWDSLKDAVPGLFIDNCASGGRRIDLETVRRAVPMWRSDITCQPITEERHCDVWNQNHLLGLSEYLPYHACSAWELDANEIRSVATSGLACEFDVLKDGYDFDRAVALLEEVSQNAALWNGDFYPLTKATLDEDVYAAWQLADGPCGCAAVFRRAQCPEDTFLLQLKALEPTAVYQVEIRDEQLSVTTQLLTGQQLMDGLVLTLPQPHTSVSVRYTAK